MSASAPDLPVLFQTGYGEEQLRQEMENLKDCHVVTTPASIPELSRVLRELLGDGPQGGKAKGQKFFIHLLLPDDSTPFRPAQFFIPSDRADGS